MVFMDSATDALLISAIPGLTLLLYAALTTKGKKRGKELYFVLGLITITEFYIFATDPSLINALYTSKGDYTFPLEVAGISSLLLIVSYIFFRRHLGQGQGGELS